MPVDLRALPEKLELPASPGIGRWCLVVLLCAVLGAGLVVLLWPGDPGEMSLWFWCCVVVFPLISGLLLFALRRLVYERQLVFAQGWNQSRGDQEQALIQQGQRAIAMLATSYATAAGNNQLARALRNGSKPLQPTYLTSLAVTLRLSQLAPVAQLYTTQEYAQRLTTYFQQVMRGLEGDFQRLVRTTPVRVRIRHNQVLGDDEVLSLWCLSAGDSLVVDSVVFATQDDGLLWLDAWLDDSEPYPLLLSLEVNLFQQPIAEQGESVSALLLAQPEWCARQNAEPTAWIHRPVPMTNEAHSLQDVLLWGRVEHGDKPFFVWQAQVPGDDLGDMSILMRAAGHSLDIDRCQPLDDSLGTPGSAVGNIALVVASEQATAESQPQLVMLQDVSAQWCVVRPAG